MIFTLLSPDGESLSKLNFGATPLWLVCSYRQPAHCIDPPTVALHPTLSIPQSLPYNIYPVLAASGNVRSRFVAIANRRESLFCHIQSISSYSLGLNS